MNMFTPARRRFTIVAAPMIVGSMVLTGCGAASSSSASGSKCTNLKIGILTAFTGELGGFGKASKDGFDLSIAEMKASKNLPKGWKVDTVIADEKTSVEIGLRAATKMMQSDHVSAILGPSSGPIMAMATVAARNETPIISQFAGTTNFSKVGGKWLFRTVSSDASDGLAAAEASKERSDQKIVLIAQNDQSTLSSAEAASQAVIKGGGTIVDTIKYSAGQPSYQSVVQKAMSDNPDAIYLAGGQESAITILREMQSAGLSSSKVLVSADLVVPEVIKGVGASWADGLTGITAKGDTQRAEYKAFAASFSAKYNKAPDVFVDTAYDASQLTGLAAVAAKSTCGKDIASKLVDVSSSPGTKVTTFDEGAAALAKGEDIDYVGASGPVDFDKTGTVAGSYAVLVVKGGQWTETKFFPAETFAK